MTEKKRKPAFAATNAGLGFEISIVKKGGFPHEIYHDSSEKSISSV